MKQDGISFWGGKEKEKDDAAIKKNLSEIIISIN